MRERLHLTRLANSKAGVVLLLTVGFVLGHLFGDLLGRNALSGLPKSLWYSSGNLFEFGDDNSRGVNWNPTKSFPLVTAAVPGSCRSVRSELYPDSQEVNVLIFIPSVISWTARRKQVRSKWDKGMAYVNKECPNFKFELLFVFGQSSDPRIVEVGAQEQRDFGDVYISTALDSDMFAEDGHVGAYSATTDKTLDSLIHAHSLQKYDFLVRGHDDGFLNLYNFANAVSDVPKQRLYWGRYIYNRRTGHPEMDWYRSGYHPPFAVAGFVLSADLAGWLATSSVNFSKAYPEDAAPGRWMAGLEITHLDDSRFHHLMHQGEDWARAHCDGTEIFSHHLRDEDWIVDDRGFLKC